MAAEPQKNVLVIEDDLETIKFYKFVFTLLAPDINLIAATNTAAALAQLNNETTPIGAVILDEILGDAKGSQFYQTLDNPPPAVIVTATETSNIRLPAGSRIAAVCQKPVDNHQLVNSVRSLLT